MMLDTNRVDEVLNKYPDLEVMLLGGVVSRKLVREVLDLDRWLMDDIYKKLLLAQAVVGVSSSCFKATPLLVQYIRERRINSGNKPI